MDGLELLVEVGAARWCPGRFTSMFELIIPEVSCASSFSLSASVRLMRSRLRHVLFVL
jgi:hypothetical protein